MNQEGITTVNQWSIVSSDLECVLGIELLLRFEDYGSWRAYRRKPEEVQNEAD